MPGLFPNDRALLATLLDHVERVHVAAPTPDGPITVTVELALQLDGSRLWAVRRGSLVLSRAGVWDYEPLPSSRTKAWLKAHRFPTFTAAWRAALEAK